jgi:hypothetical protein
MATGSKGKAEFVVWADGPDGPVYLDDTGTGVLNIDQAKKFLSEADAKVGLVIADLAPTGVEGEWRVERIG